VRRVDLHDPEERRRAVATLRLAADVLEKGGGEDFAIDVRAHHAEAFVARFVAMRETPARRVRLQVTFVAEPGAPALPEP
jgi:hypothetical protein